MNKDWKCPCCFNECFCNQCKKNLIKIQKNNTNTNFLEKNSIDIYEYNLLGNSCDQIHSTEDKNKNVFNEKVYPNSNNIIISKDICEQKQDLKNRNDYFYEMKIENRDFEKSESDIFFTNQEIKNKNDIIEKKEIRLDNNIKQSKILNLYSDKAIIDNKFMKIIEKRTNFNRQKIEYVPESMFLNLKRLREEYTKALDHYKDSIK